MKSHEQTSTTRAFGNSSRIPVARAGSVHTRTAGGLGNRELARLLHAHRLQARLEVSHPHDPLEQEADRVADELMHMPEPEFSQPGVGASGGPRRIQRLCSGCEEELQREMSLEDEEPLVQAKREGTGADEEGAAAIEPYIASLSGRGEPLAPATRAFMEPRFGVDFGHVRLHTDSNAAEGARAVNALAFTVGRDIVFAAGHYAPETDRGRHLLAHELTHVMQQGVQGRALQRFFSCETAEHCPPRARREAGRARSTPHQVEDFPSPEFGILVSNFAVDDRHVKPDLYSNLTWVRLVAHMGIAAADEWEILGFTDCEGLDPTNSALRQERAAELAALVPSPIRGRVRTVAAAPLGDCITSNLSESGRSRNRSALVRRLPGSRGPTAPAGPTLIGPVRPPGAPGGYCVPYTSASDAVDARLWLITVWLPLVQARFGTDVHDLWRDYLARPKGSSLSPRVFRGGGHPIVDAFRTDPETVRHQGLLFADVVAAAARTSEANIPVTGSSYLSPPILLGALLPSASLTRTINYPDPHLRIPGNIAGGTGVMGTGSSDAGPDLRLFTGSVRISRRQPGPGVPEIRSALIDLQLQVVDAVDFCPGAPGGAVAQQFTIPMSRLEATPTEPTYDLPFHVFADLSGSAPIP